MHKCLVGAFVLNYIFTVFISGCIIAHIVIFMKIIQSAKILLLPSKCEIIFGTIAPHLLIALPTLQKLLISKSLLKFLCKFCRLFQGFFSVLLPIYIIHSYRTSNYCELISKQDGNKIRSDNFTRSNRENTNIAIAILEKLMIGWHHNYFVFWWQK